MVHLIIREEAKKELDEEATISTVEVIITVRAIVEEKIDRGIALTAVWTITPLVIVTRKGDMRKQIKKGKN